MLYCIVLGDAIRNAFLVKVSRESSISDLRETIKKKTDPRFNDISANALKLWKVDISTNKNQNTKIHAEDEDILKQLVDENELNPFQDVGDYVDDDEAFSDQNPTNRAIRIAIQPVQPDYGKDDVN